MVDPLRVRPLKHRLLVQTSPVLPPSNLFPGVAPPPRDLLPSEIPQYLRQRLLRFLEAGFPVPPGLLDDFLPCSDAGEARRIYREMRDDGVSPGDCLDLLGIIARPPWYPVPEYSYAKILKSGCDCLLEEAPIETEVIIGHNVGDFIDDRGEYRIIECSEPIEVIVGLDGLATSRLRLDELEREHRRITESFRQIAV